MRSCHILFVLMSVPQLTVQRSIKIWIVQIIGSILLKSLALFWYLVLENERCDETWGRYVLVIYINPIVLVWEKIFAQIFSEFSSFSTQKFQQLPAISKGSLYFSFLPVKHRDFPGNVRSGGCDSLPLVVAFNSKQHDSLLSYALHFLHIISHQMCCAGERAECRAYQSAQKSPHPSEKNAREAFSEECIRLSRAATSLDSALLTPKLKFKEKKNRVQTNQLYIYHWSMSA